MLRRWSIQRLLLVVLLALTAWGCSSVPGTDRDRLDLLPQSTVDAMGREAFEDIRAGGRVIQDGPAHNRVARIADRIIEAAQRRYPRADLGADDWEVVIVDDNSANAFALPGGRIGVHTRMLDVADTDDALAIVIGHEVAHVLARHASERLSQHLLIAGGLVVGAVALDDEDETIREVAMAALGAGAQLGVALPYSRLHEREADELGLFIAAEAGYDPDAAIPLWRRMARESTSAPLEFLSTHPHPESRIERLQALLPEARAIQARQGD